MLKTGVRISEANTIQITCTKIMHKTLSFCTIISFKIYYKLLKHKITPFNRIKLLHTQSFYY